MSDYNKVEIINEEEKDSNTDSENECNCYKEIKASVEDNDGENKNIKEEDKITVLGASVTIIKAIIGTGITNMPMLFKVLGIIPASILMILNLLLHINTVRFLMLCKQLTQRYSYAFYSKAAMGKFGTVMIKIAISLLSFCTCCVYLKFFGNTIYMLTTLFIKPGEGFIYTKSFYIIVVFFVIMPLMFKKDLSALKNPAKIGVVGIFIAIITSIIVFIYKLFVGYPLHLESKYLYPSGSWMEILTIVPASLDAFIFQQNTFPIYVQLKPRNTSSMIKSTTIGVFFSFIAYVIIGILGLLSYGTNINDFLLVYIREDMDKFHGDKFINICSFTIMICFFISVIFSFPINFLATRNNLSSLIQFFKNKVLNSEDDKQNENNDGFQVGLSLDRGLGFGLLTICLYSFILLVALLAKKIIVICNISGVSCNNYITLISPALFILILYKKWDKNKILAVFVLLFGILMFGAFVASEILS